jgi:hypothetical protein
VPAEDPPDDPAGEIVILPRPVWAGAGYVVSMPLAGAASAPTALGTGIGGEHVEGSRSGPLYVSNLPPGPLDVVLVGGRGVENRIRKLDALHAEMLAAASEQAGAALSLASTLSSSSAPLELSPERGAQVSNPERPATGVHARGLALCEQP